VGKQPKLPIKGDLQIGRFPLFLFSLFFIWGRGRREIPENLTDGILLGCH